MFDPQSRYALSALHDKFMTSSDLPPQTLGELKDTSIYGANDDPKLSDPEREERLIKLFAARGITVRFEGENK